MSKSLPLVGMALVCLLALGATDAQAQCEATVANNFTTAFRNGDLNKTLGDYGLIFEDANDPVCSGGATNPKSGAYQALLDKINNTFAYNNPSSDPAGGWHQDGQGQTVRPFQGWLEGGAVTLAFSSALQIGGYGDLDTTLDNALIKVRNSYNYAPLPGSRCGFYQQSGWINGGDTCMEEHAVAAEAYAWIAAYEYKRGRSTTTYVNKARERIAAAFATYDSVCIHDYSVSDTQLDWAGRGPCNVHIADQTAPGADTTAQYWLLPDPVTGKTRADILAFNRNENIVYGAGLLTLINGALVGLEEANATTSLTTYQKVIAGAFIEEAQRKTDSSGTYFKGGPDSPANSGTCAYAYINDFGIVGRVDNRSCADGDARPKIYNLASKTSSGGMTSFHEKYVGSAYPLRTQVYDHRNGGFYLQTAYAFNQFSSTYFLKDAHYDAQNWGRHMTYRYLGWGWDTIDGNRTLDQEYTGGGNKRPRLWGYLDNVEPKGYLDSIDASGVARGWACDLDRPDKSIAVDFYIGNVKVHRGFANQPNEPEVTTECNGGTLHRFAITLPLSTKGQPITAKGVDATWRGTAVLPGHQCAGNPTCTW